jgi:hypothetical protein
MSQNEDFFGVFWGPSYRGLLVILETLAGVGLLKEVLILGFVRGALPYASSMDSGCFCPLIFLEGPVLIIFG